MTGPERKERPGTRAAADPRPPSLLEDAAWAYAMLGDTGQRAAHGRWEAEYDRSCPMLEVQVWWKLSKIECCARVASLPTSSSSAPDSATRPI